LAILTGLVIATLIITGVYVGYHAYEDSLHEEIKAHSIPIEIESINLKLVEFMILTKYDLNEGIL